MIRPRLELKGLFRTPVRQFERYGCLRLDKNENTEGFSRKTIEKMLSGISSHFLAAYPEPGRLYEKIAAWHGVSVDRVLITAGSEMAIRYLFESYLDRGDEVIFLNPSFAMFDVYAALCGARRIKIDCGRTLCFNPDSIISALSRRTKIVAIANPNNPTGSVIPENDLFRIADSACRGDALVLVDEAYYHFYGKTMLTHLRRFPNLVITRTFSKACGLAGARLGYALAHPGVISELRKLQPIDHASAFALKLGEYLVDHESLIWDYVTEVEEGKTFIRRKCERLGLDVPESHGNFLLIDAGKRRAHVLEEFRKRRILVSGEINLPFPNHYIRLTVGPVHQMRHPVAALTAAFE